MIWKPHNGQMPHKWHLSKRLNQQVAQQLESNSPNWHKCLKFTPEMVQKLKTYPRDGTKLGNSPLKWHKSLKLTPEMAQKLETHLTNGTKVESLPHKWHKS